MSYKRFDLELKYAATYAQRQRYCLPRSGDLDRLDREHPGGPVLVYACCALHIIDLPASY